MSVTEDTQWQRECQMAPEIFYFNPQGPDQNKSKRKFLLKSSSLSTLSYHNS